MDASSNVHARKFSILSDNFKYENADVTLSHFYSEWYDI